MFPRLLGGKSEAKTIFKNPFMGLKNVFFKCSSR
uniref:Uncharacterized protein n=1 Tax=Anguilla anguilla TaxID=7936 RepID=A0A0E9QWJ6_ANGAN